MKIKNNIHYMLCYEPKWRKKKKNEANILCIYKERMSNG